MKSIVAGCIQLFLLCYFIVAQAKPADPPAPTLTPEQKVSVLTAQHKVDVVEKQIANVAAQLNQAVAQSPMGRQLADLQTQQQQLKAQLDTEKANVLVQAKVDAEKFDVDWEALIVRPKPTQAKAAEPPAKK
jgi:copper chaperone CopZ